MFPQQQQKPGSFKCDSPFSTWTCEKLYMKKCYTDKTCGDLVNEEPGTDNSTGTGTQTGTGTEAGTGTGTDPKP